MNFDDQEILRTDRSIQPYGLLELSDAIRYIFWFALEQGQLILIEHNDGEYHIVRTFDISIGKEGYDKFYEGDNKTPIGIYYFEDFIEDKQLDDFYGIGAFPINYPNAYDVFRKRTGSGIWLHGIPKGIDSRPLRDSRGCMVIANDELKHLKQYIIPNQTLVVNQDYYQWGSPTKTQQLQNELQLAMDGWLQTWTQIQTDKYLQYYSKSFNNQQKNYKIWQRHKRRVNAYKTWIKIKISNMNMMLYPGSDSLVQVNFDQDYQSSNYNSTDEKIQLWKKEADGKWRIIYENSQ